MSEPRTRPNAIDVIGVGLLCGTAVFAALIELMLVPLYLGSVIVPITILLALATNIVLPVLARQLIPTTRGAAAPYVAWLVVVVIVYLVPRPEGDVILPGGGAVELVGFGLLLFGGGVGPFVIALSGERVPRARQQSVSGAPGSRR